MRRSHRLYLSWFNEFLTLDAFAAYWGVTRSTAARFIRFYRVHRDYLLQHAPERIFVKAVDLYQNPDGTWTARIFGQTYSGTTREECARWLAANGDNPMRMFVRNSQFHYNFH